MAYYLAIFLEIFQVDWLAGYVFFIIFSIPSRTESKQGNYFYKFNSGMTDEEYSNHLHFSVFMIKYPDFRKRERQFFTVVIMHELHTIIVNK